jgi:hypothetical protein
MPTAGMLLDQAHPAREYLVDHTLGKTLATNFLIGSRVTVYRVFGLETVSAVITTSPIFSGGKPLRAPEAM